MSAAPLRVLVVDDSALYRKIVRDMLTNVPDVEIVGVAHNGRVALERIDELKPDLLTLDIEMPDMDGLQLLTELSDRKSPVGAIMCSSFTARGASATTQALERGAFDFVLKPTGTTPEASYERLKQDLIPKVNAFAASSRLRRSLNETRGVTSGKTPPASAPTLAPLTGLNLRPEIVVIGISTGGPSALSKLVPQFTKELNVPILIVQHMPPLFTKSLADDLSRTSKLPVREGADGEPIRANEIRIAPGGKQMKIEFAKGGAVLRVNDDAPERNCKPSVDYLFRSVAGCYGGKALGVIMTGMGDDGTEGCKAMRKYGCQILVQDEASCVVYGMPRSIIDNKLATSISSLHDMAANIQRIVSQRTAALVCK